MLRMNTPNAIGFGVPVPSSDPATTNSEKTAPSFAMNSSISSVERFVPFRLLIDDTSTLIGLNTVESTRVSTEFWGADTLDAETDDNDWQYKSEYGGTPSLWEPTVAWVTPAPGTADVAMFTGRIGGVMYVISDA